jgi:hypothetical protein
MPVMYFEVQNLNSELLLHDFKSGFNSVYLLSARSIYFHSDGESLLFLLPPYYFIQTQNNREKRCADEQDFHGVI